MLKLTNIKKDYVLNGGDTVPALKGVDLEFRPSEFVSILGPSGCGKTTLLNIIGGLDRYTDGDMSVDGISTKHYSDVDWDSYRNIRIGFIFQSYNLISHVDILTNVEMALLLAGVSKQERRQRAVKALEDVGLGEHIHKKPNQLSGGQMQRVSIARALINNPSIILADEPTGALDSNTSVQIMEILKEISYNKLIIMVTHNPELAEQYSNRIVRLKDGLVVDDTNPYSSEKENAVSKSEESIEQTLTTDEDSEQDNAEKKLDSVAEQEGVDQDGEGKKKKKVKIAKIDFSKHKAKRQRKNLLKKTSMSFASAIKLSFTNLMTKKGRTFMTAFAGSIGIIGVALVLAISNGFSSYIGNMQKTMLSGYPIAITSSATSMESLMGTYMQVLNPDKEKYPANQKVYSYNLLSLLGNMIHENDLSEEYMTYFDEKKAGWQENSLVDSVYYNYGYSYSVFNKKNDDVGKMIGANFKTVNWQELVGDQKYIESNFDVIGGRYPTKATELVLVVDKTNSLVSIYLEGMGLAGNAAMSGDFDFDQILGNGRNKEPVSFLIPNSKAKYVKAVNENTGNTYFAERSGQAIREMYNNGDPNVYKAEIVGIIRPKEGKEYSPIYPGVAYTQDLTALMRTDAVDSEIAKFRQEVDYNPLTGDKYDTSSIDFSNLDLNNIMNIINGASTAMTEKVVAQMIGVSSTPSAISIYASDFDNKDLIIKDLDAWNNMHNENAEARKAQVKYTDSAAIMINMISQIINIITIALVCFSSVSLVVSSIMIGIITYVSVVERTKEIGILRSLGARKRDVSNIFNAETFIIGLAAGAIGVLVTYILSIPINLIITAIEPTITGICLLHPLHALLMVVLSIVLTSIAGIVPSRAAAKKDPVIALRTD
ncbi:MAG: ABC transporter ATP-binding protein/permease [Clostridia bacterium]|nr:ABC transporter ATP-binding protein/permease [Clostridia bacterium]